LGVDKKKEEEKDERRRIPTEKARGKNEKSNRTDHLTAYLINGIYLI
jgi:hypothetical protein